MKIPSYNIRFAKPKDFRTILKLGKEGYPEWYAENYIHDMRHIKYCIKNKQALVTTIDKRIVAYSFFSVIWNYMHAEGAYVRPEYRKIGIGSAQLKKRIEIAKKMKLKKIMSDSEVGNKAAYAYHVRNGFKKIGRVNGLYDSSSSYIWSIDLARR